MWLYLVRYVYIERETDKDAWSGGWQWNGIAIWHLAWATRMQIVYLFSYC